MLKPVIDTIALKLRGDAAFDSVPKTSLADSVPLAFKYWSGFYEMVVKAADDDDEPLIVKSKKRLPGYKVSVQIRLWEGGPIVQLSTSPKAPTSPPVHLEFSPIKIGAKGLERLAEIWQTFDQDNFPLPSLMSDARVTRIDIAVDVLNVSAFDVFVFHPKVWKVWHGGWIHEGVQSFIYHRASGHSKSPMLDPKKRGELMVYDKRAEQIAKSIEPVHGEMPHTRIELSQKKSMKLQNLPEAEYAFGDWDVRRMQSLQTPIEKRTWMLFLDAVRIRGITAANQLLPEGIWPGEEEFNFDQFPRDLISKEKTWNDWPDVLNRSHLTKALEWAKTDPKKLHNYGQGTMI